MTERTRKIAVPYDEIVELLKRKSIYFISHKFDIPRSVPERIKKGVEVRFYFQKKWPGRKKTGEDMCTCGLEKKMHGHRLRARERTGRRYEI